MIRDKDERRTYFGVNKVLTIYIVSIHMHICVYIYMHIYAFILPSSG